MSESQIRRRQPVPYAQCRPLLQIGACIIIAATLPQAASAVTLEELFDGGSLSAGYSQFSDWELISLSSTTVPNVDLSQITVAPLSDDPTHPGLQFAANNQLSTTGINSIDLVLKFRVSALAGSNTFTGHELEVTGISFGGSGGIAYISAEAASSGGTDLGSTLVSADFISGFQDLTDTDSFAFSQSQLFVTMNAFITSISSGGAVDLVTFEQRFSQDGPPGLPGDYNQNGTVDAADYVLWRQNVGAPAGTLPNDVDSGEIGQAQYNTWRANFSNTSASASLAIRAVPEPGSLLLLLIGIGVGSLRRRCRHVDFCRSH